jgi:NAD(P)-dependent dehydrogenase (short-subunit alcohol dehydrogenase family)
MLTLQRGQKKMTFENRTFVVTGGSSGIGRRTCELLSNAGARVIILDRNQPTDFFDRYIQVDMSQANSIDAALAQLRDESLLHGLCNIAGVPGTVDSTTLWRINYLGLRHLTHGLLPRLQKGSAIVNLASLAGNQWRDRVALHSQLAQSADWATGEAFLQSNASMNEQAYAKSKEAVIVWTLQSAHSVMNQYGVRMNSVSPGPVDTPIFPDFLATLGREKVEDAVRRTGRIATPADIAPVVQFLLSDASGWITGSDLTTDGGLASFRFASALAPMK